MPILVLPNATSADRIAWLARVRQLRSGLFDVFWSASIEQVSSTTIAARVYIEATCLR